MDEGPINYILSFDTAHDMCQKLLTVYDKKSQDTRNQLKQLGEDMSDCMLITKILMALPNELAHFASAWESVDENKQTLNELMSRLYRQNKYSETKCDDGKSVQPFLTLAMFGQMTDMNKIWYLDSGTTEHMLGNREWIESLRPCSRDVKISDGSIIKAEAIGKVRIKAYNGFVWIDIILRNVLYVPTLK
ncbi:hypothetical protein ILUMI_16066, partial [Ignelater luminosus]